MKSIAQLGRTFPARWTARTERSFMKEPGFDNRHSDKNPPNGGEIQQSAATR